MDVKMCVVLVAVVLPLFLGLPDEAVSKPHGKERVIDSELSHESHTNPATHEHNAQYDHEAFLGAEEAKTFEKLTPEQSRERLRRLVPRVDTDRNTFVTEDELINWIRFTKNRYVEKSVAKEWGSYDTDGDGTVTWHEQGNKSYGPVDEAEIYSNADYKVYKDLAIRDKKRWKKADTNGDDRLSKEEFSAFLHPEEHEHMKWLVVDETLDDIDKNKDGKLDVDEYINDLYPPEERKGSSEDPDWVKSEKESFKNYRDKNKDGFMDRNEVKDWILPEDYDHALAEAKHLIHEADTEPKDGQLSTDEIVNKYDLFAGSQATDYGEALNGRHDEF